MNTLTPPVPALARPAPAQPTDEPAARAEAPRTTAAQPTTQQTAQPIAQPCTLPPDPAAAHPPRKDSVARAVLRVLGLFLLKLAVVLGLAWLADDAPAPGPLACAPAAAPPAP